MTVEEEDNQMIATDRASRSEKLTRLALLILLFVAVTVGSYASATALRGAEKPPQGAAEALAAEAREQNPFPSGRYLTAFVFVASDCGFSSHPTTMAALRELPALLRERSADYANVSVIGVSLDRDVGAGVRFLRELEPAGAGFDEISTGRSWLNEQVARFVWREGKAHPGLPQVVLIEREVDARRYPQHIEIHPDSVALNVLGRDDILAWIGDGAPLNWNASR
jgi:hypothetical protein